MVRARLRSRTCWSGTLRLVRRSLRDHRLIVVFFDLSSMQDEDIDRAVDAGEGLREQARCSRRTWWRW